MSVTSKNCVKKSILIVVENFLNGGLETHIEGEIRQLIKRGWEVHVVAGNYGGGLDELNISSLNTSIPVRRGMTVNNLKQAVNEIEEIINKNKVSIVHAHPFLSELPSVIAAARQNVPCVTTLHGPASVSDYNNNLLSDLFSVVIMSESSAVIAVSEETADLVRQIGINKNLVVIPNAVSVCRTLWSEDKARVDHWLICSRLDNLKVVGVKEFISQASQNGISVSVAGDGEALDSLKKWCNEQGIAKIEFLGHVNNPQRLMRQYSGVAGMGRVVLESLICGCPTCLVGYDGVKALIQNVDILDKASLANFSGRNFDNESEDKIKEMFNDRLTVESDDILRVVEKKYKEEAVWNKFIKVCERARVSNRSILAEWFDSLSDSDDVWYKSRSVLSSIETMLINNPTISKPSLDFLNNYGGKILFQTIKEGGSDSIAENILVADYDDLRNLYNEVITDLGRQKQEHEKVLNSKTYRLSRVLSKIAHRLRLVK